MFFSACKRKFIYFVFSVVYLSILSVNFCHGAKLFTVEQIISDTYNKLGFDSKINNKFKTQTLAYLNRPGLKETVSHAFEYKINAIGGDFFKDLFGQVLGREIEFRDDYIVFYHGQQRQFMILQDFYQHLFESVYKKAIKDFVMMRVPDSAAKFDKYKNVQTFLKEHIENGLINHWDFDEIPQIRNRLLAVNPCLFGNSKYLGECTFYYFINSSNASSIDIAGLAYKTFSFFGLSNFYNKHEAEISEMIELLRNYEQNQTGILVQIFVPKKLVDEVAYRCQPWGLLYYNDDPKKHSALYDLDLYQNNAETFKLDYDLDSIQFRILMNPLLLDPTKGVKYFRYCNETENVKRYQKLRLKLSKELADFVSSQKKSLMSAIISFIRPAREAFNFVI